MYFFLSLSGKAPSLLMATLQVTVEDIMRVARRILRSTPTLVAYTPEKYTGLVPSHERLCEWFGTMAAKVESKFGSSSRASQ